MFIRGHSIQGGLLEVNMATMNVEFTFNRLDAGAIAARPPLAAPWRPLRVEFNCFSIRSCATVLLDIAPWASELCPAAAECEEQHK